MWSADVASALTTLGVDTVSRVSGDSAAGVSVELAKLANNGCGDDLAPVSTNRVVLVRGNPDGVAAAPVLASSLANGELVTPLVVGDSLPAAVRDYLVATPKVVGNVKLALGIVAIGGSRPGLWQRIRLKRPRDGLITICVALFGVPMFIGDAASATAPPPSCAPSTRTTCGCRRRI